MKKLRSMSLQKKITVIVVGALLIVLAVNIVMMRVLSSINLKIEEVYTGNVRLNELDDTLTSLESNLETYVRTKSSDAMESYFRDEQALRDLLGGLNGQAVDDPELIAEKNIRSLSETYLELTAQIIQAKRGRNVQKYAELAEEASALGNTIHVYIDSLNNERFQVNSETFGQLTGRWKAQEGTLQFVLLAVMVAALIVVIFMTSLIIKPLKDLASAANEVAAGNLEQEALPVRNRDEIGVVTEAFNQMVQSLRRYIRQIRENMMREQELRERELLMESHLKDARLKYLQAQIDPHFLFNTLNAAAQLAMMEGAEKTEELLDNTAAFFRYNVRRNDKDTTLRDEVGLVDNFIFISKVRFGDTFVFEKNIDESVLNIPVPSMMLQPLIENSFKYGIRDLERQGRIELSVSRRDGWAEISVWDNGIGMTEERIAAVLSGQWESASDDRDLPVSNGVGIWNVMERLRLYFDGKSTFEINSDGPGTGTEILIRIPLRTEEE